jgi:hypothetical protein
VKQRIGLAALTMFALAAPAGAEPAHLLQQDAPAVRLAQGLASDLLPPYEAVTIARSAGFDPIGRPVRRGAQYLVRALDEDGIEVRVAVDARLGEIVSVTPTVVASRDALPVPPASVPPARRAVPEPRDDYVAPMAPRVYRPAPPAVYDDEPRSVYRSGPPVVYDDEPRIIYGRRPPGPVPDGPPPVIAATPDPADIRPSEIRPMEIRPRARMAPEAGEPQPGRVEPGQTGMLPPPPERFPQRVAPPAAKPAPARRTASMPKQPPLPKPRPSAAVAAPAPSPAELDAPPMPPPVPEAKPDVRQMPH